MTTVSPTAIGPRPIERPLAGTQLSPRRARGSICCLAVARPFEGLGPDIVDGIRRIKSEDGPDLILWGSSTLTSTLLEHGLVDEVLLAVYPVLLGTGKRFFADGTAARSFELVRTQAFPSGIVFNTYKVAGPLKTG